MYEYLDRRYALALYNVAREKGKVSEYLQDLRFICETMEINKEFHEVVKHPQISTRKKKQLFIKIFKGHIDEELLSFLLILIEKDRILFLREKLNEFEKIILEENNFFKGFVKTTIPLTAEQYSLLVGNLEKKYDKTIYLEEFIDASILGGVYVRIENQIMDGSLRGRLARIKEQILDSE